MAYYCHDCSYRGKKRGAGGQCPACDSFDFKLEGSGDKAEQPNNPAWRLALVIALWAYLIGHIWWKLNS